MHFGLIDDRTDHLPKRMHFVSRRRKDQDQLFSCCHHRTQPTGRNLIEPVGHRRQTHPNLLKRGQFTFRPRIAAGQHWHRQAGPDHSIDWFGHRTWMADHLRRADFGWPKGVVRTICRRLRDEFLELPRPNACRPLGLQSLQRIEASFALPITRMESESSGGIRFAEAQPEKLRQFFNPHDYSI